MNGRMSLQKAFWEEAHAGTDYSLKSLEKSSRITIQKGTRPRLYFKYILSIFWGIKNTVESEVAQNIKENAKLCNYLQAGIMLKI